MSTNGVGGPGDWRDTEFGHGQERYYGGGQLPTPPPDPYESGNPRSTPVDVVTQQKKNNGPLLVGAGVLAVALLGGGGYLATTMGGDRGPAVGAGGSGQSAQHSSSSVPVGQPSARVHQPTRTQTADPDAPQQNHGGENDHAVFTVPKQGEFTAANGKPSPIWKMHKDPRDIAGYGSLGKRKSVGNAPTFYRDGFCKTDPTAGLGLFVWKGTGGEGPLQAASTIGDDWLKTMATRDDGTMEKYDKSPTLKGVTLKDSGTKAVQFRGRTPMTEKNAKACGVKEAEVVVTAFDTGKGTSAVVAVRKLGHPDSLSDKELDKILNSIQPEG